MVRTQVDNKSPNILLGPLPPSSFRVISSPAMPSTTSAPIIDHPSVFNVLNLFRACWFLNCKHLISLILATVKGSDNNDITWINLLPNLHTHLLCQAKALAPPSYPLPLLKRVMFTFLLEVINSHGSALDKFIKTLAPCRCRAVPAPALSPLAASPADPRSGWVLDVKAQHSGPVMPVAPMAVDPPLPSLRPAALSPLPGISVAILKPRASSAAPQSDHQVAQAPGKHGLLPPLCPHSYPPVPYSGVAEAPSDWQDWIAHRRHIHLLLGCMGPNYVLPEDL